MKTVRRELSTIANEIRGELKRDIGGIIKIAALLAEARKQAKHGQWLPWIEENFSMSEATAQRYLQVNRFLKSRTVRDLEAAENLSASAIYKLAATKPDDDLYTSEAIAAIFDEAVGKRVGTDRIWSIAHELIARKLRKLDAEETETEEAEIEDDEEAESADAERVEAEAILDSSPPDIPPPPSPEPPKQREESARQAFATVMNALLAFMAQPAARFAGAVPDDALEAAARFLTRIADSTAASAERMKAAHAAHEEAA
jgi:Protein of unknown function (DUF3102)